MAKFNLKPAPGKIFVKPIDDYDITIKVSQGGKGSIPSCGKIVAVPSINGAMKLKSKDMPQEQHIPVRIGAIVYWRPSEYDLDFIFDGEVYVLIDTYDVKAWK